jgi:DNA polymerase-3 subunit beta
MKFSISREILLKALQLVIGVVDKRQLKPILSFVLLGLHDNEFSITATDLEIELIAKTEAFFNGALGRVLVPAKKLLDICKTLPEDAVIEFLEDKNKIKLSVSRSHFSLATLNIVEFPILKDVFHDQNDQNKQDTLLLSVSQAEFKSVLSSVHFAISQEDVRTFLVGMLWEISDSKITVVATDGHRLAKSHYDFKEKQNLKNPISIIVPRKAIYELLKLLDDVDSPVQLKLNSKALRIIHSDFVFTTKLIDAIFPDYNRVFPSKQGVDPVLIDRDLLKQTLSRVAVLCNEKERGVRFSFREDQLLIAANNPEQEHAEEILEIPFRLNSFDVFFNVNYLLDALSKSPAGLVCLFISHSDSPLLIESHESHQASYIVMPLYV